MYFQQFLTEVSTGDLLAFNKAVRDGQFQGEYYNVFHEVIEFFEHRGYEEIGSGAYAVALQSSTNYFIIKISHGDEGYDSYIQMSRSGRVNPHTPKVIMQKAVAYDDYVRVYFIERLYPFFDYSTNQFIQSHTKEDAPMFAYLAGEFIVDDIHEGETLMEVAAALDPQFKAMLKKKELDIPDHPGYDDHEKATQYHHNISRIAKELTQWGENNGSNHPFFRVIQEMKAMGRTMFDMHSGNVMVREPSKEVVITDPLAG